MYLCLRAATTCACTCVHKHCHPLALTYIKSSPAAHWFLLPLPCFLLLASRAGPPRLGSQVSHHSPSQQHGRPSQADRHVCIERCAVVGNKSSLLPAPSSKPWAASECLTPVACTVAGSAPALAQYNAAQPLPVIGGISTVSLTGCSSL